MEFIKELSKELVSVKEWPEFKAGDTITVYYTIKEGEKERTQFFQGVVLQRRNSGANETFTIRKMSGGIGVERVFPLHAPCITTIQLFRRSEVSRAKLYYLRNRTGKATRLKEKFESLPPAWIQPTEKESIE